MSRIRRAGRSREACVLLALVLASLALPGCGARLFARGPRPAATPPAAPAARARSASRTEPAAARAARLLAVDSLAAADAVLRAALERDPADAPALALFSKLCFQAGRHAEALERLAIVRERPESFAPGARERLLAGLALHAAALGLEADAREALAAANAPPATVAAVASLRGGDGAPPPEASTHGAAGQNNLGIARLRAGDVAGARRAFAAALALEPALPGPRYNLALLEKYYAFDDAAAARWFADYWRRSHADPDGLFASLGAAAGADTALAGGRP